MTVLHTFPPTVSAWFAINRAFAMQISTHTVLKWLHSFVANIHFKFQLDYGRKCRVSLESCKFFCSTLTVHLIGMTDLCSWSMFSRHSQNNLAICFRAPSSECSRARQVEYSIRKCVTCLICLSVFYSINSIHLSTNKSNGTSARVWLRESRAFMLWNANQCCLQLARGAHAHTLLVYLLLQSATFPSGDP